MSRNSKSPRTRWLRAGVRLCCVLLALPAGLPSKLLAVSGMEGTFEFACDAPWRMEPTRNPDGTFSYGAIPIQISIHDAREAADDNIVDHYYFSSFGRALEKVKLPANLTSLGHFRQVHIRQLEPAAGAAAVYDLGAFHEIEMTLGAWPWPSDAAHPPPTRMLCRRWAGDDPEPFRDLRHTSEWHGALWYQPALAAAGTTITLEIEVILERDPWSEPRGPFSGQVIDLPVDSPFITLKNYVRVHLATEPLPRFDRRWLYGDFHYHSQGTDNEGESGYNYRGVVRAMGAMGLDFLFATEHASSSEQLRDLDLHIDLVEEGLGNLGGDVDPLEESDTDQSWGILRDMDERRYAACHGMIYGDRGVNREATLRGSNGALPQNYFSHGSVPQIFLGGELDVVPELKLGTTGPPPPPPPGAPPPPGDFWAFNQWMLRKRAYDSWKPTAYAYGNGLSYALEDLLNPGNQPAARLYEATDDAVLVRDFQALDRYDLYGREHLVYFPASSDLYTDSGESTFIPSYTSKYGGATRRLDAAHKDQAPMLPEIERKGVAFVAHHLNGGEGGRGPDGPPWTLDHMLQKAFRSPAILGLEFWNEDTRYQSRVCSHGFCRDDGYLGQERGYERDEYFAILGYQPDELTDVPLALPEVRRGFVSGNFEGGLFELKSFSLPDGRWESASYGTEHALHHGAFDWDKLNLMGLDFEGRPALSWLAANEPRRVFMGGGSDAHGDFNHRRAGYFLGTDDANDTALGKPRNLVFAGDPEGPIIYDARPGIEDVRDDGAGGVLDPGIDPGVVNEPVLDPVFRTPGLVIDPALLAAEPVVEPALPFVAASLSDLLDTRPSYPVIRAHTQEQIIRALRAGHFCVTDGPAIRMAIDMNGNNQIDDEDVPMGDVYRFYKELAQPRLRQHQAVTILTECISTPEFGPIAKVHLYVGVQPGSGRTGEARVYAPAEHAVRDASRALSSRLVETYISQDQAYSRMEDGYWFAPELTLLPSAGDVYTFTAATTIDLDHYEAGKGISADRFFVRAFVETGGNEGAQLPPRYGFTNPIWLLRSSSWMNELPVVLNPVVQPPARPAVALERSVSGLTIEFTGILQHAASLDQPFEDVPGAISPYAVPFSRNAGFFRARQ